MNIYSNLVINQSIFSSKLKFILAAIVGFSSLSLLNNTEIVYKDNSPKSEVKVEDSQKVLDSAHYPQNSIINLQSFIASLKCHT